MATSFMLQIARLSRKTGKKVTEDLLKLLLHPEFTSKKLNNMCGNVDDCRELEDNIFERNLGELGFEISTVCDPDSNIQCDIYARSSISFLQKQIQGSGSDNAVYDQLKMACIQEQGFAHPMSAALGQKGVPAVIQEIKSSHEDHTLWKESDGSGNSSFVDLIQLYSDKSKTSLKQSAFQVYPVHITLLIFSEAYRRTCIMNGNTVVGFLPVSYHVIENGSKIEKGVTRSQRLKMLHLCILQISDALMEKN